MCLVGDAYKLPCEPALPSLRGAGRHACEGFMLVNTAALTSVWQWLCHGSRITLHNV